MHCGNLFSPGPVKVVAQPHILSLSTGCQQSLLAPPSLATLGGIGAFASTSECRATTIGLKSKHVRRNITEPTRALLHPVTPQHCITYQDSGVNGPEHLGQAGPTARQGKRSLDRRDRLMPRLRVVFYPHIYIYMYFTKAIGHELLLVSGHPRPFVDGVLDEYRRADTKSGHA